LASAAPTARWCFLAPESAQRVQNASLPREAFFLLELKRSMIVYLSRFCFEIEHTF
jgi:hypothetical protein